MYAHAVSRDWAIALSHIALMPVSHHQCIYTNVVNAKTVNSFKNEYDHNYRNDMDVRSRWACRSIMLQVQVHGASKIG